MDLRVQLERVRDLPEDIRRKSQELEALRLFTGAPEAGQRIADPWIRKETERYERQEREMQAQYTRAMIDVLNGMECLQGNEKRVIWLYYVMNKTNQETARQMGLEKRTVQRIRADAIEKMTGGIDDEVY